MVAGLSGVVVGVKVAIVFAGFMVTVPGTLLPSLLSLSVKVPGAVIVVEFMALSNVALIAVLVNTPRVGPGFVVTGVVDVTVGPAVTIKVAYPDLPAVVTVIVTVPAFTPVATPVDEFPVPVANTVATGLSLELHITTLLLGIVELLPSE